MAQQWFRLYAEFATDPKVQLMSEIMQRRLIMLLCLRCNGDVTLPETHVTFMLRITEKEWHETKELFISSGFIDNNNNILNWDKRQYKSDSSAERVAALRKRRCNVTVTPPEQIQNRTDIKKEITKDITPPSFEEFYMAYPKKIDKLDAIKAYKAALKKTTAEKILKAAKQYAEERKGEDKKYTKAPAAWLNKGSFDNEPEKEPAPKINFDGTEYEPTPPFNIELL